MSNILTQREREIFNLIVNDNSTKEIAKRLKISEKTVRNHISNVMQKLGTKGRASTTIELVRLKEISIN